MESTFADIAVILTASFLQVRDCLKSLVDIRNDASASDAPSSRISAMKWAKMPGEAKKEVIGKWEEKARKGNE